MTDNKKPDQPNNVGKPNQGKQQAAQSSGKNTQPDKNNPKQTPPTTENKAGQPVDNKKSGTPGSDNSKVTASAPQAKVDNKADKDKKNDAGAAKSPAIATKPPSQPAPKQPAAKSTDKCCSKLALVVAIISLLGAGYAVYQSYEQHKIIEQLSHDLSNSTSQDENHAKLTSLEKKVTEIQAQLKEKPDAPEATAGMSEDAVKQLIAGAMTQVQQYNDQQLAGMMKKIPASDSMNKDEIESIVKSLLPDATAAPDQQAILAESEKLKSDIHQEVEAALSKIQENAEQAQASLQKTPAQEAMPSPLIATLQAANLAAQQSQWQLAASLLGQAKESFVALKLNQAPYQQFASQIDELQAGYAEIAEQSEKLANLSNITNTIANWSFKKVNSANLVKDDNAAAPASTWADTAKKIGNNLLSNIVTINRRDESGLVAIAHNPYLAAAIRENVQATCNTIQTALLLGHYQEAKVLANDLKGQIAQYFDENQDTVATALQALTSIADIQPPTPPDISSVIHNIEQAKQ